MDRIVGGTSEGSSRRPRRRGEGRTYGDFIVAGIWAVLETLFRDEINEGDGFRGMSDREVIDTIVRHESWQDSPGHDEIRDLYEELLADAILAARRKKLTKRIKGRLRITSRGEKWLSSWLGFRK